MLVNTLLGWYVPIGLEVSGGKEGHQSPGFEGSGTRGVVRMEGTDLSGMQPMSLPRNHLDLAHGFYAVARPQWPIYMYM